MNPADQKYAVQKCARCGRTKYIEQYGLKPNGTRYRTCMPCRERVALQRGAPNFRESYTISPEQVELDNLYRAFLRAVPPRLTQ